MTQFLINRFIKNKDDINDIKVREAYGALSSVIGIIANIVLFVFKIVIGTLSSSISIVSDAFNNLSDCASSIITLVGYKIAAKPADDEHPFGHGRAEYIISLILSIIIILVGYELFKNSIMGILNRNKVIFNVFSLTVLIISVTIKIWLSYFNKYLGSKINSDALKAISKDAFNDVIATSATIISLVFSGYTNIPLDGIMGIIVSLFILRSGYEIIKGATSELLGSKPNEELVYQIKDIIEKNPQKIGYHDLMIHSYGPGKEFVSCDIEFDSKLSFIEAHNIIDELEDEIVKKTGVYATFHMDPIDISDTKTNEYYHKVKDIIKDINPNNKIHDFKIVDEENCVSIIFDLVVPYGFEMKNEDVLDVINSHLKSECVKINIVMKIEHEYI